MRQLFTLNDSGVVEVLPQAWLFVPFRAIRDKYTEPGIATVELALVYFAADYRSNYLSIPVIEDRVAKIKKEVFNNRHLNIDEVTYAAIQYYIANQDTVKVRLVRAVNKSINKAIVAVDLADINDLKDITELATITAKLPAMLENLEALEKFVMKETKMEEGVSGSGEKSLYEDE